MTEQVTIIIPATPKYLKAAARFFEAWVEAPVTVNPIVELDPTALNLNITTIPDAPTVPEPTTIPDAPTVPEPTTIPDAPTITATDLLKENPTQTYCGECGECQFKGTQGDTTCPNGHIGADELFTSPTPPEIPMPPAPPVPDAPDVPSPPPAPQSTVDSSGLPWDARIHSETKNTKVNGEWKLKRKVDKALVASVIVELRAGNPPPATPVTKTVDVKDTSRQAEKNVLFQNLMQKITGMITPPAEGGEAKTSLDVFNTIAVKHGAANLPALLQMRFETINTVSQEVDALCLTLV